jgi:Leucine-rich repeat (LRR) protein
MIGLHINLLLKLVKHEMNEAQSIQKEDQDIIGRARREQSKTLDLSSYKLGGELEEIPNEVFDLPQLEELNLYNNNIREVPERIRDLANLKRLSLVRNPIEKVPDIPGLGLDWASYLRCRKTLSKQNVEEVWIWIDEKQAPRRKRVREPQLRCELALLPRLRALGVGLLSISGEKIPKPTEEIRDLIDNLSQFHLLESLRFFGVLLEDVPAGIRDLKRLRSLCMLGAGLRVIPDWLGELEYLHYLGLEINDLTALPASLANLSEVEEIGLNENRYP